MRLWLRLACRLYPRAWRERYAEEFDALLEDYSPGWREFGDVMRGALMMQIRMGSGALKTIVALAAAGAIVAGAASFLSPREYVSSAVVRVEPRLANSLKLAVLSRPFLASLLSDRSLHLYADQQPEDKIREFLRNVWFQPVMAAPSQGQPEVRISFAYPDRAKARAVVARLTSELVDRSAFATRWRSRTWNQLWPGTPAPPWGSAARVLAAASSPERPLGPNRPAYVAAGLGIGVLLGFALIFAMRRPKQMGLLACFAAGGAAVGLAAAFAIPRTYTSTSVIQLTPPMFPERPSGAALAASMNERFDRCRREVFSRSGLQGIIVKLDLYEVGRDPRRLARAVDEMAQHVAIQPLGSLDRASGNTPLFRLSFSYSDPRKAQRALQQIIGSFFNTYARESSRFVRTLADAETLVIQDIRLGDQLAVVENSSDGTIAVAPNRATIAAGGTAAGLLIGVLALWLAPPSRLKRRTPEPQLAMR